MRFLLFYRHVQKKRLCKHSAGFTLIELLLVIVLIGVVSIAAINAFDGNEDQARMNITRLEMAELQKALLQFRRDNRQLPCMVYRAGDYYPNEASMTRLDFSDLPATPSLSDLVAWCDDSLIVSSQDVAQADNGLSILSQFPFPISTNNSDIMWNSSTQRGWNGPYISQDALEDGWGNRYRLLDPELSYGQLYRCLVDGTGYDINGSDLYTCELPDPDDASWNTNYTLPADIARIASAGPDGVFESTTDKYNLLNDDLCLPKGDDLVLCLLR
jgi:prepilin-type N-terminal cleavage/methylation domain-containing protein